MATKKKAKSKVRYPVEKVVATVTEITRQPPRKWRILANGVYVNAEASYVSISDGGALVMADADWQTLLAYGGGSWTSVERMPEEPPAT